MTGGSQTTVVHVVTPNPPAQVQRAGKSAEGKHQAL